MVQRNLTRLDELDPLEALRALAEVRALLHEATDEQLARARCYGASWRAIAAASGLRHSTARRWTLDGVPVQIRRHVA